MGYYVILLMLLLVSGSPGVIVDDSPQQSLPSAAEALHMAAEASETANSPSVKPFRSSPSMPSLSSCTAGVLKLSALSAFLSLQLIPVVFWFGVFFFFLQDWPRPAKQTVPVTPRTTLFPCHRLPGPPL